MKETWQVETERIERLRIVGPKADGKDCLDWLYGQGYNVIRSGPYTDKEMYPAADMTRFLFIAERELPA